MLVVGRVQPWKGPDVLCEALRLTGARGLHLECDWVGRDTNSAPGGQSFDALLRSRYPDVWGPVVAPIGPRPAATVEAMQREARFVVVPSTWDTLNYTALEAMAVGKVVVCSNGAGASYLIRHGENGLVFEAGDAGSLADALAEAAGQDARAAVAMAREARETILRSLSREATVPARVDAYAEVVANRGGRPTGPEIRDAFSPRSADPLGLTFLDAQPIRPLGAYLLKRVGKKLFSLRSTS